MQRSGVRRLLVMDEGDAVLGLVSVDDLLEAVAGELDGLASTLRNGALREGSRQAVGSRGESESPSALYVTRDQP